MAGEYLFLNPKNYYQVFTKLPGIIHNGIWTGGLNFGDVLDSGGILTYGYVTMCYYTAYI